MKLIKGRKIADGILADLKRKIKKEKLKPGLAVVLVGEDKASKLYVNLKKKAAQEIGINFYLFKFRKDVSQDLIISKIRELNKDNKIHGILIQLPLPAELNTQKIISSVDYRKDVDGFSAQGGSASDGHPNNILEPVFPKAIIKMIEATGINLKNKRALVLANSKRFGEVMISALGKNKIKADYVLTKSLTPTLSLREKGIGQADIIISAVGKPGLIKGEMIKKGSIIIDGGVTKAGHKILGDVDTRSAKNITGFATPVPGGVGPVTVATLMENVYLASRSK
jgi:methylenetetrahydrofolate dehydrogenase (NADP+)/methenyltetrahydrofolate cyclohydrolase